MVYVLDMDIKPDVSHLVCLVLHEVDSRVTQPQFGCVQYGLARDRFDLCNTTKIWFIVTRIKRERGEYENFGFLTPTKFFP